MYCCRNPIAQVIEDYMTITKIVLKTDIDPKLKRIIEKLYYRSKELIVKTGLEQCYIEEIDSLRKRLGEQAETAQKLVVENRSLRQTLKSRCEALRLEDSFALTKSLMNKTFDAAQGCEELANGLGYILQLFGSFDKDESYESLLKILEYNFKKAVSCETMAILHKKADLQYEGILFDKAIVFTFTEKQTASLSLCNSPNTDNIFTNKVQSVTAYGVKNYLLIPCKQTKERAASEFLAFMNKKDARGAIIDFNKNDETVGKLSAHIYLLITKYYEMQAEFDKLRKVKKLAFETAYELLCFVKLLVICRSQLTTYMILLKSIRNCYCLLKEQMFSFMIRRETSCFVEGRRRARTQSKVRSHTLRLQSNQRAGFSHSALDVGDLLKCRPR